MGETLTQNCRGALLTEPPVLGRGMPWQTPKNIIKCHMTCIFLIKNSNKDKISNSKVEVLRSLNLEAISISKNPPQNSI